MEKQEKDFYLSAKESLLGLLISLVAFIFLAAKGFASFNEGGSSMLVSFFWFSMSAFSLGWLLICALDLRKHFPNRSLRRHS